MTKRARPHFRVSEFASGQPFIVFEQFDGDELALFKRTVGFDLAEGTTIDEAKFIAKFMSEKLIRVSET